MDRRQDVDGRGTAEKERGRIRKAEIVQRVAEILGGPNVQAQEAVEAILATIRKALRQGVPVILGHFGTWQVRAPRARVGRNPKTSAAAVIPPGGSCRFVVSQTLQQAVAQGARLRMESARDVRPCLSKGANLFSPCAAAAGCLPNHPYLWATSASAS